MPGRMFYCSLAKVMRPMPPKKHGGMPVESSFIQASKLQQQAFVRIQIVQTFQVLSIHVEMGFHSMRM